ncbi:MAG: efflux RND transporter permease subunit [Pseudomonadota bacterium]
MKREQKMNKSGVLSYFIQHRTAANVIMLLFVVLGLVAVTKIRAQFLPDVVIEAITVRYEWAGAGAQDIDQSVIAIMEPQLRGIDGVDTITTRTLQGNASIRLEFQTGWDMTQAMHDVTSIVEQDNDLPDTLEEATIIQSRWFDRVVYVALHAPIDPDRLAEQALRLQNHLFQSGIVNVTLHGINDPELRVTIDQEFLRKHNLSLREVGNILRNNAVAVPSGEVENANARLRTGENLRSIPALENTIIKPGNDTPHLRLGDLADIAWRTAEDGVLYRHKDHNAVLVEVSRGATGDVLDLQRTIDRVVADFRTTLPGDIALEMYNRRADAVEERLGIVLKNGGLGLILVVSFLFLFLSARSAFWVAAGIPIAMCTTMGLMYLFGITMNLVSLFGLIICLGIIVDDAIVIAEHADHLHRQGLPPHDASLQAVTRMMGPVICASLTTIIAFGALVLVGGRFGQLIADIPFTVIAVLIASLAEVFIILPAHLRHAMQTRKDPWYDGVSRWVMAGFDRFREGPFMALISFCLRIRYVICSMMMMVLLLSLGVVIDRTVPWRFFNAPERGTINANIAMLPGATRTDTSAMIAQMDSALTKVNHQFLKRHGKAPVAFHLAKIGGSVGRGLSGTQTKDRDLLAGYSITLIDPDTRPYSAFAFIRAWKNAIEPHPMLEQMAVRGERSGPGGDALEINLSGQNLQVLHAASIDLQAQLLQFGELSGHDNSLSFDKEEWTVSLTPKGISLGFTMGHIQEFLRDHLSGITIAEFALDDRTAKLRLLAPKEERGGDILARSWIKGERGWVSLSEIVSLTRQSGFGAVYRKDGRVIVQVLADMDAGSDNGVITDRIARQILPDLQNRYGITAELSGLAEQEKEFLSDASLGVFVCLLGIYICLCWVFASWSIPIVILSLIPFGLIGAIWGHYIHNVPLSMFSVVGMIGMCGIIVNDAIVLISQMQRYLRTKPALQALALAASDRLRAVWLTTCTTVAGLTPMLFETSRQAQFLKPTVITLVYGLGLGMVLVLVLTPCFLAIGNDCAKSLQSSKRFVKYLGGRRRASRSQSNEIKETG